MKRISFAAVLILLICAYSFPQENEALWEQMDDESEFLYLRELFPDFWRRLPLDIIGYDIDIPAVDSAVTEPLKVEGEPFILRDFRCSLTAGGDDFEHDIMKMRLKLGGRWELGYVSERDAGEELGDFNSYFAVYRTSDIALCLGNYSAGFGEGLVLWRGFDWGGYPENPITPKKNDFMRGYYSTGENNALFGGGAMLKYNRWRMAVLYSDSRMDASVDSAGVQALNSSGIHISPSERKNEDRLRERLTLARLRYDVSQGLSLGITASEAVYTPGFAPGDSLKEVFDFTGSNNRLLGTDWRIESKLYESGGETAVSEKGAVGFIGFFGLKLEAVKFRITLRHFDRDFRNLRAVYPQGNEQGMTMGLRLADIFGGRLNGYIDIWRRPWRTYNIEMPPDGYTESISYLRNMGGLDFSLRIRRKVSNYYENTEDTRQFRVQLERKIEDFRTGCRLEKVVSYQDDESYSGSMLSWWMSADTFLGELFFRITAFSCPYYSARIYQYEPEVPGLFSLPFYYGDGVRIVMMYEYELRKWVKLSYKAAWTEYTEKSGSSEGMPPLEMALYLGFDF
ncbi:hypothetical protein ISS30_08085 [bacterium]|nr:hypothetical protein [FCB group bacterium]MBL7191643.1 hypothetical protein [bacterium]